jgi:hypothetical protein
VKLYLLLSLCVHGVDRDNITFLPFSRTISSKIQTPITPFYLHLCSSYYNRNNRRDRRVVCKTAIKNLVDMIHL